MYANVNSHVCAFFTLNYYNFEQKKFIKML